jgi:hypothetical protein
VVIFVCASTVCGRANAHPEFSPVTINRYLKLDLLSANEVRLAYTVMYGAGPALAERRRADSNSDGRLDEAETRALGERLRSEVLARLSLSVDGQPVRPVFESPAVGLAGNEVGPSPFSIDLVARIACPGNPPHTLVLDDATELSSMAQLGETEIRVEESPRTRLLEAHRGKGEGPRESRILFRGPKFSALEDRTVKLSFEAAQPSGASDMAGGDARAKHLGLVLAALLLLSGVAFVVLRRYRNMKG